MANESLRTLIAQGLQAAKAGGDVARQATSEIQVDASDDGLKRALEEGTERSRTWMQRIEQASSEAGPAEDVGNRILQAHYDVSKEIRRKAADPASRDLGIIAAGQLALHYWIASFGTLRTYASACGMEQTANEMQQCLDEAKQADQEYTRLARNILSGRFQPAGVAS